MLSQLKFYHSTCNSSFLGMAGAFQRLAGVFDREHFAEERQLDAHCGAILRVIFAAAALSFSVGCQNPQKVMASAQVAVHPSVVLGAGDIVRVTFPGAPELNQAQKVRPDGKIGLPLIGEVEATGKSLSVFQDDLARLYKPKLQNSTVVLSLEMTSAAIYISGAVNKPGKFMLERPMTALEAIMEAGGFTPGLANPKKVILVRQEGGQHRTQILDLSPALRNESTSAVYLKPYDVLVIPERMF